MSADNGIYIGVFPTTEGGTEYRVIHTIAIDNVAWGNTQQQDAYRALYFGGEGVFITGDHQLAVQEASRKEQVILNDEYCPVLEYGVNTITFDRPLVAMTEAQALSILEVG